MRSSRHVAAPEPPKDYSHGVTAEVWIGIPDGLSGVGGTLLAQWREAGPNGDTPPQGVFHLLLRPGESGPAPAFLVNTDTGVLAIQAENPLAPGTHHLAGTYDGETLRLFANAEEVAAARHPGCLSSSVLPVTVGRLQNDGPAFAGRIGLAALFSAALTPCQIASKHLWHRIQEQCDRLPEIELEACCVLDGRQCLRGHVRLPEPSPGSAAIHIRHIESGDIHWSGLLEAGPQQNPASFEIPLQALPGGYYRIEFRDANGNTAATNFVIRETASSPPNPPAPDYSAWLRAAVDRILAHQTKRLPERCGGVECVTTDLPVQMGYRSLAYRKGNTFHTGRFSGRGFDYDTFRMDHEIWPVLDGLSDLTGDPRYRALADGMVAALAQAGFDPRCGLPYFSEEIDFDVVRGGLCSRMSPRHVPTFKPINTGPRTDMHIERLWKSLPDQTHRWLRATFHGHVTDPVSMDFNRVTFYCFDDSLEVPALTRDNAFCGFETCASSLIYFWISCWVYAEDAECLDWAKRMTSKWSAVRHPQSGLVPNFFGAGPPGAGLAQEPGQWAESRGAAVAAEQFLRSAALLRRRGGAQQLADQLDDMGRGLAVGTALHAYDAANRRFREHLHLDGRPFEETARYCFRTQKEKDAAVRVDPLMAEVPVFDGAGLYRNPNYYEQCAGSNIPYNLSGAALLCRDPELVELLRNMAADAVEEAAKIDGAFTPENRWTFRATGWYVEMCLRLFEITGDKLHLDQAKQLADREITALETVRYPHWWRLRERTVWLDALLHLDRAAKS